ncbi:YqaA family protein [Hydromonas duriensis]|uniref:Membrane protein YqaA with SNARE-associated domain n=1 Tax=Hydromonas duriensis TaxID=1527608 RepID=A0A4R6YAI1_9BURK|nr:YqaA family protein [Hydromonas duriensis]TDR32491.1 membrane protein YqaA with SNARE-associated domain [Hydromonas duriensis]
MPEWLNTLLTYFALPDVGLPAVFIVAFVSATLLPMATEPVLFGYVKLNPDQFWLAIVIATIGNTAGGMVTYWMGRGAKNALAKQKPVVHLIWLQQLGAPVLLLSWVPLIGDALCAMAGWLKLPWRGVLLWMGLGKFIRFAVATAVLMWIPDGVWKSLQNIIN